MNTTEVAKTETKDKGLTEYEVGKDKIKLSYNIVRNFLTKGDRANIPDSDVNQFIAICKFNQLNPFLNEAYLVKFGTAPAQMIVSKEALMKRAEANASYEGFEAGLILMRDGELIEVEGSFYLNTDEILGAWAKVYRKDRKFPVTVKIPLSEYDKKQAMWNEKKSTMIIKVAKVQALREAFPCSLNAMYIKEEQNTEDIDYKEVKNRKTVNEEVIIQTEPIEEDLEKYGKPLSLADL